MKTIGLLGGMSWESTVDYYRGINTGIKQALGGLHSARIVLYSVDFQPIERLQHAGDWPAAGRVLADAARRVEAAGADGLLLCTNTMHKVADEIERAVSIPFLHIADPTAAALVRDGVERVGLLGTAFTMEQDFYKGRLRDRHGLEVMVPGDEGRKAVHEIIYQELCQGSIRAESRQRYLEIIDELARRGAQAVILGCTEIGLLVKQGDTAVPLYDTTQLHVGRAVDFALG
ncbi:aspartate/glutamate racemase family protein [Parapusillimonas granuli]|uniref:Aspartate/glutamate racemase family protein n=1 Tax=Parapusillimonas granuli TaxID=380911 RepID=A0A853FWB1_9BURK|nr:aspartate/glutamate racemase family protein [Parapusillimonas granuli]MBB5216950.1 aspartate racemase [Parapusillimonas granuli]MEB2400719.1 aspartate/glutamate racemase family protein [Alcaligenaceae bacterium]NYT50285.1 aspartate/glutamate racemase family protein [Parapusillimonas granuli]